MPWSVQAHWVRCQHKAPCDNTLVTQGLWWEEDDKGGPRDVRLESRPIGLEERDHLACKWE